MLVGRNSADRKDENESAAQSREGVGEGTRKAPGCSGRSLAVEGEGQRGRGSVRVAREVVGGQTVQPS